MKDEKPAGQAEATEQGSRSLEPGDEVMTPSGARARVIRVHPDLDEPEALVEWRNGDTAKFRVKLLKHIPEAEC